MALHIAERWVGLIGEETNAHTWDMREQENVKGARKAMRILGIAGSNRKDGNSYLLLREILKDVSPVETKIIQVAELDIRPCELCFELCSQKPLECVIRDGLEVLLDEMRLVDGAVIACPFYFYVPSKFQALLERISCLDYFTRERHGERLFPLAGKPCALIAVSASGSSFNAFQILHHLQEFALMLDMRPVVTDSWPYIGLSARCGFEKGAVLAEEETIKQGKELVRLLVEEIEKLSTCGKFALTNH